MNNKLNIEEFENFVKSCPLNTKIYIGADSEKFKIQGKWYADYTVAVVVHIAGKHGCRVFGETTREIDYDKAKNRPRTRLMTEVYKAAEMYLRLKDILYDYEVEVHLDISSDPKHGSNCVIQEAIGYIRGMCNVIPLVKPNSWAASYVADRFVNQLS